MGKKSGPETPDLTGAATVEGEFARETARDQAYAQNANQSNALGSSNWTQELTTDPATGEQVTRWVNNQTLSDPMQQQFDTQNSTNQNLADTANAMGGQVSQDLGTPADFDQFGQGQSGPDAMTSVANSPAATTTGGNTSSPQAMTSQALRGPQATTNANMSGPQATTNANMSGPQGTTGANISGPQGTTGNEQFSYDSNNRSRAEDAAYKKATSRLDPQMERERATLERQLTNRGLRAGDSAFDSAMGNFGNRSNDAYEQARLGSVSQGRMEDQQSYGQAQGTFGTNRATEQQRFDQSKDTFAADRGTEQQRFNQSKDTFAAERGTEQQAFNQGQTAFGTDRATEQQAFNQGQTAFGTDRATEQQAFNQGQTAFGADRGAEQQQFNQEQTAFGTDRDTEQQSFDQKQKATDSANALRSRNIEEYLGKRGQSLKDQNALRAANTTGDTISNFGSGG
jgi:hypothetical protein